MKGKHCKTLEIVEILDIWGLGGADGAGGGTGAPLMKILSGAPSSSSTHSSFNSYSKLMKIISSALLSHHTFFIQFLLKADAKSSPGCPPRPVVASYSVLIQNWCQMLSWRPSSPFGGFLCKSYIELMEFPSGTSSAHFLFNSHTKLMIFLSWATFAWPLRISGFPLFHEGFLFIYKMHAC